MSGAQKTVAAVVMGGILAAVAVVALGAQDGGSGAKSYSFPEVRIDATLQPDGTLALRERRTFDFRGPFSFAFFTVDSRHAPPENIRGFTVRDQDGRTLQHFDTVERGDFKSTWYFDALDERRTFTISYRVRCAVDVYEDAAHLLWQFVGVGWTEPTDVVRVDLRLPGRAVRAPARPSTCPAPSPAGRIEGDPLSADDVRAWGHGPLNGRVRITDDARVLFTVRDVQPGQFVEGSVLLPPEAVPLAPQSPERRAPAILAEETRLAGEANALRRRHDLETLLTKVLLGLVPLAMAVLLVVARRRDRVRGVPAMLQEPPEDMHPVELAVLWSVSRKRLSPKTAYRAQFLHLARTGAIALAPVGAVGEPRDFEIRRRRGSDGDVAVLEQVSAVAEPAFDSDRSEADDSNPQVAGGEAEPAMADGSGIKTRQPDTEVDRRFVQFLFAGTEDGAVSLRDVRAKGVRRKRLDEWWKAVGGKTKRRVKKIQRGRSRGERRAIVTLAIAASAYGWWRSLGFGDGDWAFRGLVGPLAFWLIPVSLASAVLFTWLLPLRMPTKLRELMARWASFRRFLTRFSTLEDAPTLAVIIWERYLVYAVALGVADRVERQVRAVVPAERLPEPWPGAPTGDTGWRSYHHWQGSARSYTPAGAAAAVGWSGGWGSGSSGGGGGGGFSGGGGGGGGGTGGGAG